jgi:putative ABC transport system permease protein
MLTDLKYALRMLVKTPGFTSIAVLTLALGIAANTIIFSAINAFWLRPLPLENPDALVCGYAMRDGIDPYETSLLESDAYQNRSQSFISTGIGTSRFFNLVERGEAVHVSGAAVSADYFTTLGVKTVMGRIFQSEEDQPGGAAVAVISYELWQRMFGGEPGIVGRVLNLDQRSYTVVGVLAPEFDMPFAADVWVPLQIDVAGLPLDQRAKPGYDFVGRLRPGGTREQADTELKGIARSLEQEYPQFRHGWSYKLISLRQNLIGDLEGRTRKGIFALVAAVAFVLLICCANLANLLLARGVAREREISIRFALGASRFRIVRQLLTESLLLAFFGGTAGLILAYWLAPIVSALSPVQAVSLARLIGDFRIEGRVVAFSFLLSLVSIAIFGFFPALKVIRSRDLITVVKQREQRAGGLSAGGRWLDVLVVSEIALAASLLVAGALIVQSFRTLQRVNLGFRPTNLLVVEIPLSPSKYYEQAQRVAFVDQVLARVKGLPGFISAATTTDFPLQLYDAASSYTLEGHPLSVGSSVPTTIHRLVSPDYFKTLGATVVKGRALNESDTAQSLPVAVVNEELARKAWPGEEPIGKQIRRGGPGENFPWLTVVGVVGNIKEDRFNFRSERPAWYLAYAQQESNRPLQLIVRSTVPPVELAMPIRAALRSIDPTQPISRITTMSQHVAEALIREKFSAILMGTLAATGLILAVIGLYGVLAYSVGQRTGEIGLRMALGAQARDIFGLVIGHGFLLLIVGLVIGLSGAYAITHVLAATLYQISPTDPFTFLCVATMLAIVALLACLLPARRATLVDPIQALRTE